MITDLKEPPTREESIKRLHRGENPGDLYPDLLYKYNQIKARKTRRRSRFWMLRNLFKRNK